MFNLSRGEDGASYYKVKVERLLAPIHEGETQDSSIPDDVEDVAENIV